LRAFSNRKIAKIAVTPWKAYAGTASLLKGEYFPQNTSAITYRIQAAEASQTTTAAIHHNII